MPNNPQKWEVWWAKVKFEDEPDIIKIRPVIVFDNKKAYIISFKVTGQMPRISPASMYCKNGRKQGLLLYPW